jgi:hypothetical protein
VSLTRQNVVKQPLKPWPVLYIQSALGSIGIGLHDFKPVLGSVFRYRGLLVHD